MIKVEHLVKRFGLRKAVDDISFEVEKGTVLGFLGPNGAGKTTTIRMMAGYLPATSGRIWVNGIDVNEDPVRAQRQIGYMPENTPLYDEMTAGGFLEFVAEIRGFRGAERSRRVDEVLDSCMLGSVRHQPIETLSKGYRRRTCLAQTLIHDPPVLLLDEPTEGLDPNQKQVVRDMIERMAKDKIIMLSTHVLEEVEAVCSRAMIISEGRLKADGAPAELKKRSASYNVLTVEVLAPAEEAAKVFGAIPDVERVEPVTEAGGKQVLRLIPKDRQSLAVGVIEAAARHKWMVVGMRSDSGRLDEVFRQITTTDDVIRRSA
ncbi:MAG TPA: ATP-binding cassette domain-containing protein [Kiritimatiellia bacterium]|jgi:ABC-2 type transport system ATP-binding protein|nr:ATP-binding cassette domain-containing protein [Kiritimatiellia bacterium]HOO21148.1 ATP-binding cassette domain-containing protein [Kiritimatiellia bacterium]HRX06924.1 ATP-binding cassette domain-containing protein [Kiritimatiellia bacterium]